MRLIHSELTPLMESGQVVDISGTAHVWIGFTEVYSEWVADDLPEILIEIVNLNSAELRECWPKHVTDIREWYMRSIIEGKDGWVVAISPAIFESEDLIRD